jgi:hypothetical protein
VSGILPGGLLPNHTPRTTCDELRMPGAYGSQAGARRALPPQVLQLPRGWALQEGFPMAHPASPATAAPTTERGPGSGSGAGGPLERVTVNLTARSSRALSEAVQCTGDSKTDTINRAIQIYAYIERVLEGGGAVYVRENPDGEPERLKIF